MSVKSSNILPASQFYHVGIMAMFMMFLACLCSVGFFGVQSITKGWLVDIDNQILIEIPADNAITGEVELKNLLSNDPIITNVIFDRPEGLSITESISIPSPLFVSVQFRPDRANNAEGRVIKNIETALPDAIIKTHQTWEKDIQKTAQILQFLFAGLVAAIMIVSSIMMSAIIRMQIKSHLPTLELVHLLGASASHIARIFMNALNLPLLWGGILGFGVTLGCLYLTTQTIDMAFDLGDISLYFACVWGVFIILGRVTTYWTVVTNLKKLP